KFFSNLITGLLSGTIESRLPSTLQNFLNSDLRDWIFKDGLNVKLDTEAINLVGVTAHNILTQSFVKQFPLIQKKLNQKLSETQYLDVVMRILGKIDKFVASSTAGMLTNLDGLEKNAAKDVGIYLSGKLTGSLDQIVENYKNDNPMYFSDRDLANCNDTLNTGEALMENGSRENLCNKTSPIIDTELARIGLRCLKLTPEEITKLVSFTGDAKVTGDEATGLFSLTWGVCKAAGGNRPRICQSAGYCWDYDGGSNKAGQCKECAYVTVKDANLKGINKGTIIAGAVNGFSSLLSAFLQTIIYTAVKYTEVYVQDNILTPLRPFISQMQAWQTQFHKFVTEGTLADILPSSVN
ncbi:MAG: hypothetical protein NTV62_01265, partial [Candidatus Gribaldobacteria bacterium]|nr:hypothetical protein [Candidatus Gribaldobacteria bacterium]